MNFVKTIHELICIITICIILIVKAITSKKFQSYVSNYMFIMRPHERPKRESNEIL